MPLPRRKHRYYIDVTYSSPVDFREGAKGLQMVLDERLDLESKPVWGYENAPYIEKLKIVEA